MLCPLGCCVLGVGNGVSWDGVSPEGYIRMRCVSCELSYLVPLLFQTGVVLKAHRVRYLCFLGIARDDRFCGYIIDTGEKKGEKSFKFYGFRMEPNTDRLCLSLHAACQARYKRVREATSRQQQAHQEVRVM